MLFRSRSCIVILEVAQQGEHQVVGVVVDAVSEVLDIPAEDIEPAPAFGTRIRRDFIAGMGKVRERFVILLDAQQALAMDELTTLAEEGPAATAAEPALA